MLFRDPGIEYTILELREQAHAWLQLRDGIESSGTGHSLFAEGA